ncbi:MAG: cytochrome b, partial [Candidatus Berkiella sp.]
ELTVFVISFVILGYLGLMPPSPSRMIEAQVFSILYFAFFLLMPIYSKLDKTKPVPSRLTYK